MADLAGGAIDGGLIGANAGGGVMRSKAGEAVTLGAVAADTTSPVVDNYSPAVGSTVNEADPIFFDVTDNSGLFAAIIVAIKQGGATEQVHDGTNFLAPYLDLSSRSNITNGYRYRIRRTGGWIDTVVQSVSAVDAAGNVAA